MMILVILFNGNNNLGDYHQLCCKCQHHTPASQMLKLALGCETVFYKSSAVADMGYRARAKSARNGAAVPLSVGELGLHLTQCYLGQSASFALLVTGR